MSDEENKVKDEKKQEKARAKEEARLLKEDAKREKQEQKQSKKQGKKSASEEKKKKKKGDAEESADAAQQSSSDPLLSDVPVAYGEKVTKKELYSLSKEARKEWKKLPRKERKKRMKQQLDYERRLIAEGKIAPRTNYHARGAFWRVFSVCLALFFGIFVGLGGLIGTLVLLVTKSSTKELLNTLGISNEDVDDILTQEYSELNAIALAQKLIDDIVNMPVTSLERLANITPLVDFYLDIAVEQLGDLGVNVSKESLKTLEFDHISSYLWDDVIPTVTLGDVLQLNEGVTMQTLEDQAMFYTLCYGTYGVDYTVVFPEGGNASTAYSPLEGETQSAGGTIQMLEGKKAATMNDFLGEDEGQGINNLLNTRSLGSALGLDINVTDPKIENSAMLYSLCYGTKGEDYEIAPDKTIKLLREEPATTFGKLIDSSASVLEDLELGAMLGLNNDSELRNRTDNALMYSLAYGTENVDYEVVDENGTLKLKMIPPAVPKTVHDITKDSGEIIDGIVLESMLNITAESDPMMRFLAFGPEMAKGDDGEYLKDEDGNYLTVPIEKDGVPTKELEYKGGGKYVIEEGKVKMLPDPNKKDGSLYPKKNIGDLTDEEADLLHGLKIGDVTDIDDGSSGLMKAIKDWTIDDLKDPEKIEDLKIGDVMEIDGESSGIMRALQNKSIRDLKQQETIDGLKLSDVMTIDDESSGIMKAMKDWTISDLGEQERINRLHLGQILDINAESSRLMQAMKNWRIEDLTEQDKINSLTLADVLEIKTEGPDASPKILQSLAKKQIGNLGDDINSMRLCDILDEDELNDNKILRNLKMSSLDTLSEDVKTISVKEVFGDEMYSYLEIEGDKKYIDIVKAYDPTTENSPVPEAYDLGDKTVEVYRVLTSPPATELTLGWFDGDGKLFPEGEVYRGSRPKAGQDTQTEYFNYVEVRVAVTAETKWQYMSYEKTEGGKVEGLKDIEGGFIGTEKAGVEVVPYEGTDGYKENEEQLYFFMDNGDYYPLRTDGYEIYYVQSGQSRDGGASETTTVRTEVEKVVTGYKKGAETVNAEDVLSDEEGYYILEKHDVTQKWYTEHEGKYTTYTDEQTEERYRVSVEGATVQLDRYLSGVWALLFQDVKYENEGKGKVVSIEEQTGKAILDISANITEVASHISETKLWRLYLFGIINEDPFVDMTKLNITLYPASDKTVKVTNLNECSVIDCIELVRQLTNKLSGSAD